METCRFTVDGDKMSANILLEDESIEEINKFLNSWNYYLTPDGKIAYSVSNDISDICFKTLTKDY